MTMAHIVEKDSSYDFKAQEDFNKEDGFLFL